MNKDLCVILLLLANFAVLSAALPWTVLKFIPQQEQDDTVEILRKPLAKKIEPLGEILRHPMQYLKNLRNSLVSNSLFIAYISTGFEHHPFNFKTLKFKSIVPNPRLKKFEWSDCGNSSSKIVFKDISVTPDPIVLPGTISVSVNIVIHEKITHGLLANMTLEWRSVNNHFRIPCIDGFGSCNNIDVCTHLDQITNCPEVLVIHGIPCHCPFKQGKWFLPSTKFQIPNDPLPKGDYTLKMVLHHKQVFVGCLKLAASFQNM